jgi:hypothetical protein
MLHFGSSSYVQTSTDVSSVSISRGVDTHRLEVQLVLAATGLEPGALCQLSVDLHTTGALDACWLSSAPPQTLLLHSSTGARLQLPLTSNQIIALTERYAGKPVPLELRMTALLLATKDRAECQLNLRIPASVWQDAVEALGGAVTTTLTIGLPAADGTQREGAEYLLEARRLLNAGEIDSSIVAARQAMERAESLAGWPGITKADDLRERTQSQRWRAIYRTAFDQASGAQHADEVTKDFRYSRAEAEALLAIAHALLQVAPKPL